MNMRNNETPGLEYIPGFFLMTSWLLSTLQEKHGSIVVPMIANSFRACVDV